MSDNGDRSSPTLREQARTAFTELLEELLLGCPGAVATIFSDAEGEAVDYCTYLDAFDTQIVGAQWSSVVASLSGFVRDRRQGALEALHVRGERRDFLIHTVGEGYYITIVLQHGLGWGHALTRARAVARALRDESRF